MMKDPSGLSDRELGIFLNEKARQYECPAFVEEDPVCIPHRYTRKEDVEIAAFFAAILAWGRRSAIITNAGRLMQLLDHDPYNFVTRAQRSDLAHLGKFVHRTFNGSDCIFFVEALKRIYLEHRGPEAIFTEAFRESYQIGHAIHHFRTRLLSGNIKAHAAKHLSDPFRNSAAKRINLFLRWMVRPASGGVDFGLWKGIPSSALMCPLDVHTASVARNLGLLTICTNNWKAVCQLTEKLRLFCPEDPVKYDYALFGLGRYEGFGFSMNQSNRA